MNAPAPDAWAAARRAYSTLLGPHDPVPGPILALDPVDLRPGGPIGGGAVGLVVASGPDDLVELRAIVEHVTGIGTWPTPVDGEGELHTVRVEPVRPGPALALLLAMEGLIEDRSPWGLWRSVVDTLADRVGGLRRLTFQARIVESDR